MKLLPGTSRPAIISFTQTSCQRRAGTITGLETGGTLETAEVPAKSQDHEPT